MSPNVCLRLYLPSISLVPVLEKIEIPTLFGPSPADTVWRTISARITNLTVPQATYMNPTVLGDLPAKFISDQSIQFIVSSPLSTILVFPRDSTGTSLLSRTVLLFEKSSFLSELLNSLIPCADTWRVSRYSPGTKANSKYARFFHRLSKQEQKEVMMMEERSLLCFLSCHFSASFSSLLFTYSHIPDGSVILFEALGLGDEVAGLKKRDDSGRLDGDWQVTIDEDSRTERFEAESPWADGELGRIVEYSGRIAGRRGG
ncbi:hypothetical protein C8J56DRAFT_882018 [Mycena floridula]|nr:hypothetical protein C8J56DRAFT_882018 [Mycena floridula]